MKIGKKLIPLKKLPPITDEDRMDKIVYDTKVEGTCIDLGEDVELKEQLAKKFCWKKAKEPLVRVLWRSGNIILYADYFYHYIMDEEQAKDYGDYKELVDKERQNTR